MELYTELYIQIYNRLVHFICKYVVHDNTVSMDVVTYTHALIAMLI